MKKSNSLAEVRPDLAAQWDYDINGALTPENITAMSKQKVSWICERGHKWVNDPQHRMRSQTAECPFCAGKRVTPGVNDMVSLYPRLGSEWDYAKNGDLDPHNLPKSSNRKVWWICKEGHGWKTSISHRTNGGTNCPYCAGQCVIDGVNDLLSQCPSAASEWDYAANAPLLPSQVTAHSKKRVWWVCQHEHHWKTTVAHRPGKEPTGCPYCDGRRAISGKTDLATLFDALMEEWDWD